MPLRIAATFTPEPLEPLLDLWLDVLGFTGPIAFADYAQVLPELLNPSSAIGQATQGLNILLIRPEDAARFKPDRWDDLAVTHVGRELAQALQAFGQRSRVPTIVACPPMSPHVFANAPRRERVEQVTAELEQACRTAESLHWLDAQTWQGLGVEDATQSYDPAGDDIGHMPYTDRFHAALATALARRVHALTASPAKVIALDCDHTLWKGVVGEDGVEGIQLTPGFEALQRFVVEQQQAGMIVCLVSKNAEADALAAFEQRGDFPLRREQLVAWRINWEPKVKNLMELAAELNVGLDSFIFLDDNPVEVGQVREALPMVTTLAVPEDDNALPDLVQHAWCFDRLTVTEEDRRRTEMYRQNAARTATQQQAGDIGSFLASLELSINIDPPADDQWARVSQLTQRTNQFNFTTVRRSEADVRSLSGQGQTVLRCEVSDRFGDYGLVGVMVFGEEGDTLTVDTMLLSCRVLGRGVEHAMLARLGEEAKQRGLAHVTLQHIRTAKNEPAKKFLDAVAHDHITQAQGHNLGDVTAYRLPTHTAADAAYRPGDDAEDQLEFARTGGKKTQAAEHANTPTPQATKSQRYTRIATELRDVDQVLAAAATYARTARPANAPPPVAPKTAMQRELAALWSDILGVYPVGIHDAFDTLGGTSLAAARMFVAVEDKLCVRLPMTTILDAPTVESLAERITSAKRGDPDQDTAGPVLRVLREPTQTTDVSPPTLFLVHDGDGETLLYLNLAKRLPPTFRVIGIEPWAGGGVPLRHTRLPEMACAYVAALRERQPDGPYRLGGMCAGGTIAFEMALQLQAAGQTVSLLTLLDAADAQARRVPLLEARRRLARFTGRGKPSASAPAASAQPSVSPNSNSSPAPSPAANTTPRRSPITKITNLLRYEMQTRRERRAATARFHALHQHHDPAAPPPQAARGLSVRAIYDRTVWPTRPPANSTRPSCYSALAVTASTTPPTNHSSDASPIPTLDGPADVPDRSPSSMYPTATAACSRNPTYSTSSTPLFHCSTHDPHHHHQPGGVR